MVEIPEAEQNLKKKRIKRNEDSLRDLWDNIKCINIQGPRRREEKERI